MTRRIDTYLRDLIDEDRFDFYSAVRDFSDAEVAPESSSSSEITLSFPMI